MTEEDFVFAWLLASRAGSGNTAWTYAKTQHLIENGKQVYKQATQECKDETDSRTED